jgi:hypothetical protein
MWKRRGVALVLTSTALVALHSPPAGAAPVPVACGATLTTSVVLTADLTCNTDPLVITAANVTVDLGGHTINMANARTCAPFQGIHCAIEFDGGNGSVKNGTLNGAGVSGPADITGVTLTNASLWLSGRARTVFQSFVTGGNITLSEGDEHVVQTWMKGGGIIFLNTFKSLTDMSVTGSLIVDSPFAGIREITQFFGEDDVTGDISGNVIVGSAGPGIRLAGKLQNIGALTITGNTANGNVGSGIDINGTASPNVPFPGGPVTLKDNTTNDNGGRGIDARWLPNLPTGIVDGGGNKAAGNAKTPACVGVVCS